MSSFLHQAPSLSAETFLFFLLGSSQLVKVKPKLATLLKLLGISKSRNLATGTKSFFL